MKRILFVLFVLVTQLYAKDFIIYLDNVQIDRANLWWNRFDINATYFVVVNGITQTVVPSNSKIGPNSITTTVNLIANNRNYVFAFAKGITYTAYSQYVTITPKPSDNIFNMSYRDLLAFNDNIINVTRLGNVTVGNNVTITSWNDYDVYITEIIVGGDKNGIVEILINNQKIRHYVYPAYGYGGQIFSTPLKIPQKNQFVVKLTNGETGNHFVSYSYYIKR